MMDRRAFLKGLAAALAAPIAAKIAVSGSSEIAAVGPEKTLFSGSIGRYEGFTFYPQKEYGNEVLVLVRGLRVSEMVEKAKEILMDDARRNLPKGTRFSVIDGGEQDYGNAHSLAWFYSPKGPRNGMDVICEAIA